MQNNRKPDSTFMATCIIYIVILLTFVLLRIAGSLGIYEKIGGLAGDILFSFLSQIVIMLVIPIFGFWFYKRMQAKKTPRQGMTFAEFAAQQERGGTLYNYSPDGSVIASEAKQPNCLGILRSWGFNNPGAKVIGFAFLLGLLLFFFNIFVSGFFHTFLSLLGYRFPVSGGVDGGESGGISVAAAFFVGLLLIAVLPGLCEEVSHRGLLLNGLASRIGIMRAVVLSSVMFGLMHLNIVQVFYATILGFLMALAALATRSIWTAVIMHFMNNALATYFSFAGANGWFGANFFIGFGSIFNNLILYLVATVLLYFVLMAIIHAFARENYVKDRLKSSDGNTIVVPRTKGLAAVKYYLTAQHPQNHQPLRPLEKTLLCGIIFLGVVITGMTLVWGLPPWF